MQEDNLLWRLAQLQPGWTVDFSDGKSALLSRAQNAAEPR
jgi:hypothetical protein